MLPWCPSKVRIALGTILGQDALVEDSISINVLFISSRFCWISRMTGLEEEELRNSSSRNPNKVSTRPTIKDNRTKTIRISGIDMAK